MITIKPNTINLTIVKKRWYHYIFEKLVKTHDAIDLCSVRLEATICCNKNSKTFIKPKKYGNIGFTEGKYNKALKATGKKTPSP